MKELITFSDFQKLDLRAGTILEAVEVEGSGKLLRLLIDLGEEKRQIIAGIRKSYEADTLLGKQVIIIANLEPRSLSGLLSQGMVLAAHDSDGLPVLLHPERQVPGGSIVS